MAKKRKSPQAATAAAPTSSKKAKKRGGGVQQLADLYEAEDSDPDEEKHGRRYDVSRHTV